MGIEIVPLGSAMGVEVRGVDLSAPLDPAIADEILAAVDEHLLVVFRSGDHLPANEEIVAFCRSFGPLRPTTADRSRLRDLPLINLVSNRVIDGVEGTGGCGLVDWHSDLHFEPPLVELLYLDAVALPVAGGDTRWTNLCAAYDALDDATKDLVDGLGVRYQLRGDLDFDGYLKASEAYDRHQSTTVSLVQRNPRTGRKSIWPNSGPGLFAARVVGMDQSGSDALLDRLYRHAPQPEFV